MIHLYLSIWKESGNICVRASVYQLHNIFRFFKIMDHFLCGRVAQTRPDVAGKRFLRRRR